MQCTRYIELGLIKGLSPASSHPVKYSLDEIGLFAVISDQIIFCLEIKAVQWTSLDSIWILSIVWFIKVLWEFPEHFDLLSSFIHLDGGGVHQTGVGLGLNPALGHPVVCSMWLHTVCPHFMQNSIFLNSSILFSSAVGIVCDTCVHWSSMQDLRCQMEGEHGHHHMRAGQQQYY